MDANIKPREEAYIDLKMKAFLKQQEQNFSFYFTIEALKQQIIKILQDNKKKESNIENLIIVGGKRSGKTELAVKMLKALLRQNKAQESQVVVVKGSVLNHLDLNKLWEQLEIDALIIEKISEMEYEAVMSVKQLMEAEHKKVFIVIEDEQNKMDYFLDLYPGFERKFANRIEIPVLNNKELVNFAELYSEEKGYTLDDMGRLALYAQIDRLQTINHFVTLGEVEDIINKAMQCAETVTIKHFFKEILGKNKDLRNKIILSENDFKQKET